MQKESINGFSILNYSDNIDKNTVIFIDEKLLKRDIKDKSQFKVISEKLNDVFSTLCKEENIMDKTCPFP